MNNFFSVLNANSGELIAGIIGIIGVVVGGRMAANASARRERVKDLQSAYADVFAGYYSCLMDNSDKNILLLVIAIERAALICSDQSAKIMKRALPILAEETIDSEALGEVMEKLRISSKKDMCRKKCK